MSDIARVISLVKDFSEEELSAALEIRHAIVPSPKAPEVSSYAPTARPVRKPPRGRKPTPRRASPIRSTWPATASAATSGEPVVVPTTAKELRAKPARAARRSARIRTTPAPTSAATIAKDSLEKDVLAALEKHGSLRAEHVRQFIGGDAREVKATLAQLKRRGAITATGNRRATAYQVASPSASA
jgi:hypothetical protein